MSEQRLSRRRVLGGLAAASVAPRIASAQGQGPIKVGELNSYTRLAAFCIPYRNAMQLAL